MSKYSFRLNTDTVHQSRDQSTDRTVLPISGQSGILGGVLRTVAGSFGWRTTASRSKGVELTLTNSARDTLFIPGKHGRYYVDSRFEGELTTVFEPSRLLNVITLGAAGAVLRWISARWWTSVESSGDLIERILVPRDLVRPDAEMPWLPPDPPTPAAVRVVRPADSLGEAENERIFREEIVPQHLSGGRRTDRPMLIVVGGQTGAGKAPVTRLTRYRLDNREGYIEINMDDYNPHHPRYWHWLGADPAGASARVRPDGQRWWDKARQYAIQQSCDVLLHSAMRDESEFEDILREFRAAGYRVEAALVAAPAAWSGLGIVQRFWRDVLAVGRGRVVDPADHDATYAGVLRGAEAIDRDALVDRVAVYRRDGHQVHHNDNRPDDEGNLAWTAPPATAHAVNAERNRVRTGLEYRQFITEIDELSGQITPGWRAQLRRLRNVGCTIGTTGNTTGAPDRGRADSSATTQTEVGHRCAGGGASAGHNRPRCGHPGGPDRARTCCGVGRSTSASTR